MLNADDPGTVVALRQLSAIASRGTNRIVFWIGAGASRWLGYPSWKDLSHEIRRTFAKQSTAFDNKRALTLLNKGDFPSLFQMCKDLDLSLYNRFIVDAFSPKPQQETYRAFISLLSNIRPAFIVTTNVDEALETSLGAFTLVQRSDTQRCINLLQEETSFIAKLHGSVSSVASTILATSDYQTLTADPSYLQALKYLFSGYSMVFLGYGVRDNYVIRLLAENAREMNIFGAGPHFAVTNETLPSPSLHRIQYSVKLRSDHNGAMTVLDYIIQSKPPQVSTSLAFLSETDAPTEILSRWKVPTGKTAYYISDVIPPGTWSTSQEITAKSNDGDGTEIQATFGLGFTDDEIIVKTSTAMHDLVVGLICFDYIYLPFPSFVPVHTLLGSNVFWDLVRRDVLRFVHTLAQLGVSFKMGEPLGALVSVTTREKDGVSPQPVSDIIARSMHAQPGKEKEAEALFKELEQKTIIYDKTDIVNLPSLARSALLMPGVSKLLGIGDAIVPSQVPRWLRYSYLRVAHLVQTAALCSEYGIKATKVSYGGTQLVTAAFGVQPGERSAEQVASYALTRFFNSDLGALVQAQPAVLFGILRFRESADGESFRREVGQALSVATGREFSASVNAGLKRMVPVEILQKANDKLLSLMTESAIITRVPAVWGNVLRSDNATSYWRAKSQRELLRMCGERGIGKDDPCICGSGQRFRLCCLAPLKN